VKALSGVWELLKDTVVSFIDDDALSRGAGPEGRGLLLVRRHWG